MNTKEILNTIYNREILENLTLDEFSNVENLARSVGRKTEIDYTNDRIIIFNLDDSILKRAIFANAEIYPHKRKRVFLHLEYGNLIFQEMDFQ